MVTLQLAAAATVRVASTVIRRSTSSGGSGDRDSSVSSASRADTSAQGSASPVIRVSGPEPAPPGPDRLPPGAAADPRPSGPGAARPKPRPGPPPRPARDPPGQNPRPAPGPRRPRPAAAEPRRPLPPSGGIRPAPGAGIGGAALPVPPCKRQNRSRHPPPPVALGPPVFLRR